MLSIYRYGNLGITSEEWRLGTFFTRGANPYVGDKGGSNGSPIGLMKFLVQLEQGKLLMQNRVSK